MAKLCLKKEQLKEKEKEKVKAKAKEDKMEKEKVREREKEKAMEKVQVKVWNLLKHSNSFHRSYLEQKKKKMMNPNQKHEAAQGLARYFPSVSGPAEFG